MQQYDNLVSALEKRHFSCGDHDLVFIPGSDITDTGEYQLNYDRATGFEIADKEMDIVLKEENRGNERLKGLFEEMGIRKALSNHFHESGHKACDETACFGRRTCGELILQHWFFG